MSLKIRMLLLCVFCSLIWLGLGVYFLGSFNHKTQIVMDMSRSGFFDWLAGAIAGASLVLLFQHGLSLFRVRVSEYVPRVGRAVTSSGSIPHTIPAPTSLADDAMRDYTAPLPKELKERGLAVGIPDEIRSPEEREALMNLLRSGVKVRFKQ